MHIAWKFLGAVALSGAMVACSPDKEQNPVSNTDTTENWFKPLFDIYERSTLQALSALVESRTLIEPDALQQDIENFSSLEESWSDVQLKEGKVKAGNETYEIPPDRVLSMEKLTKLCRKSLGSSLRADDCHLPMQDTLLIKDGKPVAYLKADYNLKFE